MATIISAGAYGCILDLLCYLSYIILLSGLVNVAYVQYASFTFLGASYSMVTIMLQDMFEEYDMIFLFWARW